LKAEKVKSEHMKEIRSKFHEKQFRFDELKYKRSKHERQQLNDQLRQFRSDTQQLLEMKESSTKRDREQALKTFEQDMRQVE